MKQMTVREFLQTPNVCPLTEGELYISGITRAIPPDVELVDLDEYLCDIKAEMKS